MKEEYYIEHPIKPVKRSTAQTIILLLSAAVTAQTYGNSLTVVILFVAYAFGLIVFADKGFRRWRVRLTHRQFYITIAVTLLAINVPMALYKIRESWNVL